MNYRDAEVGSANIRVAAVCSLWSILEHWGM